MIVFVPYNLSLFDHNLLYILCLFVYFSSGLKNPVHNKVHFQHKVRGGHSSILNLSHCLLPSYASSKTQHKSRHCHKNSSSERLGSLSISRSHIPSSPSSFSPLSSSPSSSSPTSTAHSPYHLAPDSSSTCQRSFLNTAEILNQLGLLAITLRTKELLKQNVAIEREITQLHQHTHLLSQASQNSGTEVSHSLDKLFQIMRESGLLELGAFVTNTSTQQRMSEAIWMKAEDNLFRV